MNNAPESLPTAAPEPVGAPVDVPAGATGAIPVPAGAPPVVIPEAEVPTSDGAVPNAPEQTGAAPEVGEGAAPVTNPVLPPETAPEDRTPAEIVGRHIQSHEQLERHAPVASNPTATTVAPGAVGTNGLGESVPIGAAPTLEQRVAKLEAALEAFEKTTQEGIEGNLQQITGISNQLGGVQQNLAAMAGALGQLAARVNQMDPKRPVLEVTYCAHEPADADEGAKQIKFKATVHNDSHPERPGQLDALMLNQADPNNRHWQPVNITKELSDFIAQGMADSGMPTETWVWIRLRELKREPGFEDNFTYGTDDTTPADTATASEDTSGEPAANDETTATEA